MATFGSGGVKLRDTGQPAEGTALVGSVFALPLVFKVPVNGVETAVDLTTWTVEAKAELRHSEWTADDELRTLGDVIDGTSVITVPVTKDADQTNNPGLFYINIAGDVVPMSARDIAIDETDLPTLAIWIRIANSGDPRVEQARVAIGFRRGYGSL